jgi:2-amino-4-hydroxy-6-hydroxymethyldihydropteridine diphosphokinase
MSVEQTKKPMEKTAEKTAFIGLGSNLHQPVEQLKLAVEALQRHPDLNNVVCSRFYASKPQGPQDQPDFVNAVARVQTALDPFALLAELQAIEQQMGKVKHRHWGERCIDLDLLLYEQQRLDTETLKLPHPHMAERDFVLLPLQELAPDLAFAPFGESQPQPITHFIQQLQAHYVVPLNPHF